MLNRLRRIGASLGAVLALLVLTGGEVAAQEVVETSVSLGRDQASLSLELADGRVTEVLLSDGRMYVDGVEAGTYTEGGPLDSAWRDFLSSSSYDLAGAWSTFSDVEVAESDQPVLEQLAATLGPLITGTGTPSAAVTPAEVGEVPAPASQRGEGSSGERVAGGLVVQVPELESASRTLRRIGLAEGLSEALGSDVSPPLRIVVEADSYVLPEGTILDESLVLVETDAIIAGTVLGTVVVAESDLVLESTASISGDVISVESEVENLGATIGGTLRTLDDIAPVVVRAPRRVVVSPLSGRSPISYVASGMGGLLQTAAVYLLMCFFGFLIVYFFRSNLETVSDTVAYSFGRSFLTGLFAEMLVLPILVVLVVLVLTWIAIPFYVLGVALAALLGYLAVAHAAGENLTRRRYPSWAARLKRSNSYYYILNGLVLLLGLFAVAAVAEMAHFLLGWLHGLLIAAAIILTWVAATAGFGGVLLSRAGTQRRFARPVEVPTLSHSIMGGYRSRSRARARQRRGESDVDEFDGLSDLEEES